MTTMTAAQAIDRSISHDEIVTLDYDAEVLAALIAESEGNVEANGMAETWGTTNDGDEWRVHVRDAL